MKIKEEERGIAVDPLQWALKHRNKLRTIKYKKNLISPGEMLRDKKRKVIKIIQEEQEKLLKIKLLYNDYVLFHRICWENGYLPTEFIQKMNESFEIQNSNLLAWLHEIKKENPYVNLQSNSNKVELTEEELYAMLEEEMRNKNEQSIK